jgi:CRISPR-associated endonuclease/helicase Cas3
MMVIFVSQCEKKALNRTRRVLDSFADRIGDNTWQTVITEEGLIAVKRMLKKTASKSTAVSCHWIRGRSRSELLWVVGNRSKFDNRGCVAVNSTSKKIQLKESNWGTLPVIRALVALSALLHDWGKATNVFQEKLQPDYKGSVGDPIRHEWISCVLLDAFIRNCRSNNTDWLNELAKGNIDEKQFITSIAIKSENIFSNHDSIALSLMWLILSHHRLPLPSGRREELNHYKEITAKNIEDCLKQITVSWGYENRRDEKEFFRRVAGCFEFSMGLMSDSNVWIKDIKRWASKLVLLKPQIEILFDNNAIRAILQHARLCLMLGDHFFSSKYEDPKWQGDSQLYANTDRKTRKLKQKLDEHLVGVKKHALEIVNLLPKIQQFDNEEATAVYDNKALKKTSTGSYLWQQKTVNQIISFKKKQLVEGAFIVNMASTGCGKTFANAKIMQALSVQSKSIRFVLALGLRSLTLQTGDEYRERVGLRDDELAVASSLSNC